MYDGTCFISYSTPSLFFSLHCTAKPKNKGHEICVDNLRLQMNTISVNLKAFRAALGAYGCLTSPNKHLNIFHV